MIRIRLLPFLLAPLLLALAGCASVGRDVQWSDPGIDLVWPEPPERPRIRYLRSVPASFDQRTESTAGRFLANLAGESKEELPMLAPYGVAADGEGRIWVSDSSSRGIHFLDLKSRRREFFRAAGKDSFQVPVGLAFDPHRQNLYVSDSGLNRLFVLDPEGRALGEIIPPGGFMRPGGLAVDETGNLYATDVLKGTVEVFAPDGQYVRSLTSGVSPGAKFSRPTGVAVGPDGRVYVLDSMSFRIEILSPDGRSLGIFGALGDVPGAFARPRGVAVDSKGHVYVSDAAFDNIQVFDSVGRLLLYFGSAGKEAGAFNLPAALFFDEADRLYVVDSMNRRLQIFLYVGAGEE